MMIATCAPYAESNWGLSTFSVSIHSNVRRTAEKNDNGDIQISSTASAHYQKKRATKTLSPKIKTSIKYRQAPDYSISSIR